MNEGLAPLSSFVLPGGSAASAHLHLARTVVRRAERLVTALAENEPVNPVPSLPQPAVGPPVRARAVLNDNGAGDVLWEPVRPAEPRRGLDRQRALAAYRSGLCSAQFGQRATGRDRPSTSIRAVAA